MATAVFHEGEIRVQELANISSAPFSMIRPYMPEAHREFFSELPFLLVSTLDNRGKPWLSIVTLSRQALHRGERVAESPDDKTLILRSAPLKGDPLWKNLQHLEDTTPPIGLLGIMLHNRRRNRVNGHVVSSQYEELQGERVLRLEMKVDQSYGNCPKYIQLRDIHLEAPTAISPQSSVNDNTKMKSPIEEIDGSRQLTTSMISLINSSDTFFIATCHAPNGKSSFKYGLDASHRGGSPGFLKVLPDKKSMVFPDYKGNNMFMTLGNMMADGRTGITIIGFDDDNHLDNNNNTQDLSTYRRPKEILYMTGNARVLFNDEASTYTPGFRRCTLFTPSECILVSYQSDDIPQTLPFTTKLVERSPFNPRSLRSSSKNDISITATLLKAVSFSPRVNAYHFVLSQSIRVIPGQHVALDFSNVGTLAHIRDSLAQQLGHGDEFRGNDDLVRVWTVASAVNPDENNKDEIWGPENSWKTRHLQLVVKQKEGGLVTQFMHQLAKRSKAVEQLKVQVLGISGEFSVFDLSSGTIAWAGEVHSSDPHPISTSHSKEVVFLSAGTGITPALSMLHGLVRLASSTFEKKGLSFHVVYVVPHTEELMLKEVWNDFILREYEWLKKGDDQSQGRLKLSASFVITRDSIEILQSKVQSTFNNQFDPLVSFETSTIFHPSRPFCFSSIPSSSISLSSLPQFQSSKSDTEVFMCGPEAFMSSMEHQVDTLIKSRGLDIKVRKEEFSY